MEPNALIAVTDNTIKIVLAVFVMLFGLAYCWSFCKDSPTYMIFVGLVAGPIALYSGISAKREYRLIQKDSVRTMGIIVDFEEHRGQGSSRHRPIVEFESEQNSTHRVVADNSYNSWELLSNTNKLKGQQVPVLYYRPDPNLAVVEGPQNSYRGGLALFIGVVLLINSGVGLYLKYWRSVD